MLVYNNERGFEFSDFRHNYTGCRITVDQDGMLFRSVLVGLGLAVAGVDGACFKARLRANNLGSSGQTSPVASENYLRSEGGANFGPVQLPLDDNFQDWGIEDPSESGLVCGQDVMLRGNDGRVLANNGTENQPAIWLVSTEPPTAHTLWKMNCDGVGGDFAAGTTNGVDFVPSSTPGGQKLHKGIQQYIASYPWSAMFSGYAFTDDTSNWLVEIQSPSACAAPATYVPPLAPFRWIRTYHSR